MMRGFGEVGTGDQALAWFKQRLKVYPLASGPRDFTATNASGKGANTLPPEDGSAFDRLNEIIQYEPTELFNPELLGRLATLGIEKGKPFKPDTRMRGIFDQAAKQGVAMSRAIRLRLPGAEKSTTGRTGAGKRCSYAIRSFCTTGTVISTRAPCGITRLSWSRRISCQ